MAFSEYNKYVSGNLSPEEQKNVENILKHARLQVLLKKHELTFDEAMQQAIKAEAAREESRRQAEEARRQEALRQSALDILNGQKNEEIKNTSDVLK